MNIAPDGPFHRIDQAALGRFGRTQGFYTWPTTIVLMSFWIFLTAIGVAVMVSRFFRPGSVRDVVVISLPLSTLLLHVGMTYLVYRACDEYVRQRILRCAGAAGIVLAFAAVTNFSLQRLGLLYLPVDALNLCGWSLFIVLLLWVRRRAR